MAQEFAKAFYKGTAWRSCRNAYIKTRIAIDGGLCEVCKENAGYIVHHKVMLTPANINDADVALNFCNLRYECKACHDAEEGHYLDSRKKSKPYAIFDAAGNMIPVDDR